MPSQTIAKQPVKFYLLQLAVVILLMLVYSYFGVERSVIYAAVTYLVLAFALRIVVLNHYFKGVRYFKSSEYEKSISEFQKNFDLLSRYRWIDTCRYVTLLSSQISYLEISLLDIAFCYGQLGDKNKAKEYYIQTLSLFPDSDRAKDELKKIDAIKQKGKI